MALIQSVVTARVLDQLAAFGINGVRIDAGVKRLFMTHSPLDERIVALREAAGTGNAWHRSSDA